MDTRHPETVAELRRRFPPDLQAAPDVSLPSPRRVGGFYDEGEYIDEWGCRFMNLQQGIIGETREPLIASIEQWDEVEPPYETLPRDEDAARAQVNAACAKSDRFMMMPVCARPWERLQFIRSSEEAMMDLMTDPENVGFLLHKIHDYYLKEMQFWVSTDIDAVFFMDDWGSQNALLIQPELWRRVFKPLYRDYCELAHRHGKFAFMHSDGCISDIYEDLIEIGVDAINSQLFCMDMEDLARRAKGRITFWGEIDRQHVLPSLNPEKGRLAVRKVKDLLFDPAGGQIAQFEFSPGSNPDTAIAIFEEWYA